MRFVNGLSKLSNPRARVVCVLLLLAQSASAQNPPNPLQPYPAPGSYAVDCGVLRGQIDSAWTQIERSCVAKAQATNISVADCKGNILGCAVSDGNYSGAIGDSSEESCESFVDTKCKENNAGGLTDVRAQASSDRRTRVDAQKAKDDADKNFRDTQKDLLDAQNKASEDQVQLMSDLRNKQEEIQNKIQDVQNKASAAKMEAVKEAQQEYDKIDQSYIDMRATLRQKAADISKTEFDWKVQCRQDATKQSKDLQKQIDAQLAQQDLSRTNNQMSGIFGLRYRKLAKKRKQIADLYNETLTLCLSGSSDPGAGLKQKSDDARLDYSNEQQKAQDTANVLENRRTNLKTQLSQLESSTDTQTQQQITQLNQQLADAQQDYQQKTQLAQQRQANAQQMAQSNQQSNLQQLKSADEDLQRATRDEIRTNNQYDCMLKNGGSVSAERAKDNPTSYVSLSKQTDQLISACSNFAGRTDCRPTVPTDSTDSATKLYEALTERCREAMSTQAAQSTSSSAAPAATQAQ